MEINDLALRAADLAFVSKERNLVAWDSAPDRISVPGRLRGSKAKGIVTVSQQRADVLKLELHGPRNYTASREIRVPVEEAELDEMITGGLRELHARIVSGKQTLQD